MMARLEGASCGAGFDHTLNPDASIVQHLAADDAVFTHSLNGYLFHRDDAATVFFMDAHHLRHDAVRFADTQIVGQDYAEWLVADQCFAGKNGVSKSAHMVLSRVGEGALIDQLA